MSDSIFGRAPGRGLSAATILAGLACLAIVGGDDASWHRQAQADSRSTRSDQDENKEFEVKKSDAQWRKELSPLSYNVTRKKGTERPFTGVYWNTETAGIYDCICCGHPLFDSETKFHSGTGWPSYWKPLEGATRTRVDTSHGAIRTEVLCDRCGAHLGHVFKDGPPPTGLRYCMNSAALKLQPRQTEESK